MRDSHLPLPPVVVTLSQLLDVKVDGKGTESEQVRRNYLIDRVTSSLPWLCARHYQLSPIQDATME